MINVTSIDASKNDDNDDDDNNEEYDDMTVQWQLSCLTGTSSKLQRAAGMKMLYKDEF